MSRGIVYVAWGEVHIQEACRSVRENKTDLPTCLITDKESLSLALDETFGPGYSLAMLEQHFGQVIISDFKDFKDFENPLMRKYICLIETPFDETVFIDSDCIILDRISLGFTTGDFCLCLGMFATLAHDDIEYVHYNSGVLFFKGRRQDVYNAIIDVAYSLVPSGRIQDEWPLSVAIHNKLFNVSVLPSIFNLCRPGKVMSKVIRILHTPFPQRPKHLTHDEYGNEFAT